MIGLLEHIQIISSNWFFYYHSNDFTRHKVSIMYFYKDKSYSILQCCRFSLFEDEDLGFKF